MLVASTMWLIDELQLNRLSCAVGENFPLVVILLSVRRKFSNLTMKVVTADQLCLLSCRNTERCKKIL